MNRISVGLIERRPEITVELHGEFLDSTGALYPSGRHRFTSARTLHPIDPLASSFSLDDVTIGIGFHWERQERQSFRGSLRVIEDELLTAINDVPLEEYVTSVISSEMSASCPPELLKAHAVISRSWLLYPRTQPESDGQGNVSVEKDGEIVRWYGREAHRNFDVCADDHCQRYQGITRAFSRSAREAVNATAGEVVTYDGRVCDARFYKCCGGRTERYATAWEDREVPYLVPVYDGPGEWRPQSAEVWIASSPPAYCNTRDIRVLSRILPNFDRETQDFFRWRVAYDPHELGAIVRDRIGVDVGQVTELVPLARSESGRIYRLKIVGATASLIVGKELEIRRALSRSHLYSSAFLVRHEDGQIVLDGAGWGHGVGLCQIGAAVMADQGVEYREILRHYYPGTGIGLYEKSPSA